MRYLILSMFMLVSSAFLGSDNLAASNDEQPLISFGLLADIQYCDCDENINRYYRNSITKLNEAVSEFNRHQVDFVISLGDVIDRDYNSYQQVLKGLSELQMPVYHLLGNHDFSVDSAVLSQVPQLLGMTNRYYSIQVGTYRFIFLDGNDISLFGNPKHSTQYTLAQNELSALKEKNAANAMDWNGGIGDDQFSWLENELAEASEKGEKAILLCHYPLFPEGGAHNLWNDGRLRKLIGESMSVIAYLNGHQHNGGYQYSGGVHYLNVKGMVEGPENAFSILNVYHDHIQLVGYGREESRVLRYK